MDPRYYSSPVAQKSSGFDKKIIFIVIGAFLAILIGLAMLSLGKEETPGDQLARAVARHEQLHKITQEAQESIRSNDLLKINSDAGLFLTSDLATLRSLMQSAGYKEVPKEIAAAEADTESLDRLKQAALNNRYDDTYKTVMSSKIEAQQALLREISGKTNNVGIRQGVIVVYDKLENIQKQLSELQ